MRDLCGHNRRVAIEAYAWVQTEQFELLCNFVDLDEVAAREVIDGLWSVPHNIRNRMLTAIIQNAVGSGGHRSKKKEPA